ncbi:MAG: PTS sugar transporter subunit IIA [Kiritimatiellae bacterium]|nr:PTS sugar transporter subunit IIA [Kiritimatiellia bacterium]
MNEIMTIEEVAAYLRVSERTVYDWVAKGELPGGKIGTSWRFRRGDIEQWVNDRLGKTKPAVKTGITTSAVLTPERVLILDSTSKADVLLKLATLLSATPFIRKAEEALINDIMEREELMSTGIGFGIGVPHVRVEYASDLVMAIAVCPNGLKDYPTLDEYEVKIVCMLVARQDQHAEYLRTLSNISTRLKAPEMRQQIIESQCAIEIYNRMIGEQTNAWDF